MEFFWTKIHSTKYYMLAEHWISITKDFSVTNCIINEHGILQARNCLSFFSLSCSLVFLCLRALAPLSGQAWETDMDRQHSARKESRGQKVREWGLACHAVKTLGCGCSCRLPVLDFSWKLSFPLSKIELKLSPFCLQVFSVDISFFILFHFVLRKEVLS